MSQGGNFNPIMPIVSGGPIAGTIFLEGQHEIAYAVGIMLGILSFLIIILKLKWR